MIAIWLVYYLILNTGRVLASDSSLNCIEEAIHRELNQAESVAATDELSPLSD